MCVCACACVGGVGASWGIKPSEKQLVDKRFKYRDTGTFPSPLVLIPGDLTGDTSLTVAILTAKVGRTQNAVVTPAPWVWKESCEVKLVTGEGRGAEPWVNFRYQSHYMFVCRSILNSWTMSDLKFHLMQDYICFYVCCVIISDQHGFWQKLIYG